jgi:hypothetical protein
MSSQRKSARVHSSTEDLIEQARKMARRRLIFATALTITSLITAEVMGLLKPTDYSREIEKMDWVIIRQAKTPDGRTCYEEDKITSSRITHTLKCMSQPPESALSSFFKQKN